MIFHADTTPQECAKSDKLLFVVSSADATALCALGGSQLEPRFSALSGRAVGNLV